MSILVYNVLRKRLFLNPHFYLTTSFFPFPIVVYTEDLLVFASCVQTGIDNPDSGLGCYAMTPLDYQKFSGFFDRVIRDYHGDETGCKKHITD